MAKQVEKKFYTVTYTIPVQTGTIQIEAESAAEAARLFMKVSLTKLFRLSESETGDDPTIDSMTEFETEDANDLDAVGTEVDLTATWRHDEFLDASIFTAA